jgi:hypothetical protein
MLGGCRPSRRCRRAEASGKPHGSTQRWTRSANTLPWSQQQRLSDIDNLTYADFVGATSGTVTVVSETFATPLPATLPLLGCAVLGLVAFAWRRKISNRENDSGENTPDGLIFY